MQRPEDPPRYVSAADYLRVLDRHKVLIAVITLAFGAAAFLYSVTRAETYEAQAELSFNDVLGELDLLGVGEPPPPQAPAQQAAVNADLITRPEVTRQARRRLDTDLSLEELRASVSARTAPEANLLIVEGRAADAQVAADLANAYLRAARAVAEEEELDRIRDARSAVAREIELIEEGGLAAEPAARLAALEQLLSRIATLEQITEPVRIVSLAEVPEGPISPRTRRDTAIGGLVGLIFGLLAAFGRASLDRRVHTAEQVHHELGTPVLARVSDSALGYPGLASNGLPPMTESDFEPFRVLRTNLVALRSDPPPRSVLVTSPLSEEGKSTVSMALASAAAIAGQRVLLVECDLRRPLFDHRLGVSRTPGLTDYLLGAAGSQEILQTIELSYPNPTAAEGSAEPSPPGLAGTLVCIAAGAPVSNPAELLITARFRDFLAKVTETYDLVVVDSSPLLTAVDSLELIAQVDAAIVCVRAQQTTVDQIRTTRAALANLPGRPTGAVLTGVRRRGPDSYDYYQGY
jgi:capsular exopolysaccharide synthesis family protein